MAETETEGYTYRVLVKRSNPLAPGARGATLRMLLDLGVFTARTPELAIEAAVDAAELIDSDHGQLVAVPASRWHERAVSIRQVPVIEVSEVVQPEDDITADPR
jgi:hypothetical protein